MTNFKEKAKEFVSKGFNKLPGNANLFLRYMTGLGSEGLDLDDKTLTSIRETTKSADMPRKDGRFDREIRDELGRQINPPRQVLNPVTGQFDLIDDPEIVRPMSFLDFPSDNPRSGAVNPYGTLNKDTIQTLGRFQSTVTPDGKFVNVKDTFDMRNPQEDPDLVSGKIQPLKALKSFANALRGLSGDPEYGFSMSPKTEFARGLMYTLPIKPKGFDINIDIPTKGDIKNRERYNR